MLLERYPALSFSEDDDVAVQRNSSKLKEECLKPNPDIIPLQRSTFSIRREFILSGLDPSNDILSNDILEEHPVLCLPFAKDKLVPGIQKYSESFTGKAGESLKKIRENEEDLDECVLVNLFGKREPKTKQEPLKFAYNKCKVTDDPDDYVKSTKISTPGIVLRFCRRSGHSWTNPNLYQGYALLVCSTLCAKHAVCKTDKQSMSFYS